jgi:hypothetical protein
VVVSGITALSLRGRARPRIRPIKDGRFGALVDTADHLKHIFRVKVPTGNSHLVVQVRAIRFTGVAHDAKRIARLNVLPFFNGNAVQMQIERLDR